MGKNTQVQKKSDKIYDTDEEQFLAEMNNYLKKLNIEQKWEKFDDIRMIGQANRNIFYPVIAVVFPLMYMFGTSYKFFPQQNVVLQIVGLIFTFVLQSMLPKHTFTIQFPSKQAIEITKSEKERFEIAQKMYDYRRQMERFVRVQNLDKIKLTKKQN